MKYFEEDEETLLIHTFYCFKSAVYYLLDDGCGIVVSKPQDLKDSKQYLICKIDGNIRIFPSILEISDGSIIKIKDLENIPKIH